MARKLTKSERHALFRMLVAYNHCRKDDEEGRIYDSSAMVVEPTGCDYTEFILAPWLLRTDTIVYNDKRDELYYRCDGDHPLDDERTKQLDEFLMIELGELAEWFLGKKQEVVVG